MSDIIYTRVVRKGAFASPQEVENVPNSHNFYVHEEDYLHNGMESFMRVYGFSGEQALAFRDYIEVSSDDAYMAKKSFRVTVELLDDEE